MGPLILSIETATLGGGVCLSTGETVLAAIAGDASLSHSNTLLSDINLCLQQAGANISDVKLFAAACGPGSFTGLRIGLATIKGLATSLERPCVGIPTLHGIAHSAGPSEATVSLLPAGRGEVFVQWLSVSDETVIEYDEAAHLPPARAIERYNNQSTLKWVGAGALIHRGLIESAAHEQGVDFQVVTRAESETPKQSWLLVAGKTILAKHVAAIAWQRFQAGKVEQAETLSAIYVRPSDAELKCN